MTIETARPVSRTFRPVSGGLRPRIGRLRAGGAVAVPNRSPAPPASARAPSRLDASRGPGVGSAGDEHVAPRDEHGRHLPSRSCASASPRLSKGTACTAVPVMRAAVRTVSTPRARRRRRSPTFSAVLCPLQGGRDEDRGRHGRDQQDGDDAEGPRSRPLPQLARGDEPGSPGEPASSRPRASSVARRRVPRAPPGPPRRAGRRRPRGTPQRAAGPRRRSAPPAPAERARVETTCWASAPGASATDTVPELTPVTRPRRRARRSTVPRVPGDAHRRDAVRRPGAVVEASLRHQPPTMDDGDGLADVLHQVELMAREQHRGALPARSASTSLMSSTPTGSRPENGSSSTRRSGSCTSAAASCTRCWLPCDRVSIFAVPFVGDARAAPSIASGRLAGRRPQHAVQAAEVDQLFEHVSCRGRGPAPPACSRTRGVAAASTGVAAPADLAGVRGHDADDRPASPWSSRRRSGRGSRRPGRPARRR